MSASSGILFEDSSHGKACTIDEFVKTEFVTFSNTDYKLTNDVAAINHCRTARSIRMGKI